MAQTIKSTIISLGLLFGLMAAPLALAGVASAQDPQNAFCSGVDDLKIPTGGVTGATTNCSTTAQGSGEQVNNLITNIINIFSIVVGIIAVIMIVYGGLRYITSGGDSGRITGAKNTILYALIGLVIVALAQFLVRYVIGKATGVGT